MTESQMPDPTIAGPTTPTPEQRDAQDHDRQSRAAKDAVQGTVQDVKAYVGEGRTRAQFALDAENQQDSPRKSLVSHLEKLSGSSSS